MSETTPVETFVTPEGQTSIADARILAEARAGVALAHQFPRNVDRSMAAMKQSCEMPEVAQEAFYVLRREGKRHVGESVYLARELARCWGNMLHGTVEVSRGDKHSEMLTFAWDLESNTRASMQIVVPHAVGLGGRTIHENNASDAARRLRELIFSLVPAWFVQRAVAVCYDTLTKGDGTPLKDRIETAIGAATAAYGISRERIVAAYGRKVEAFSAIDLAQLHISLRSIERGEAMPDQEFPTLMAEEIRNELKPNKKADATLGKQAIRDNPTPPKALKVTTVPPDKPKRIRNRGKKHEAPKPEEPRAGGDGGGVDTTSASGRGGQTSATDGATAAVGPGGGGQSADSGVGGASAPGPGAGVGTARPPGAPPPPTLAVKASAQRQEQKKADEAEAAAGGAKGAKPAAKSDGKAETADAKGQGVSGAGKAAKPPADKAGEKPPAKPSARLDLNGEPSADDDPEAFLLYWMKRLRAVVDNEPLVANMSKHVHKKLTGLASLVKKWDVAVKARADKTAALAKSAA